VPGNRYGGIARWNGALGNFTSLALVNGIYAQDGDVIKATIVGSTITGYLNGTQVFQVTDTVYTTGQPGMGSGFYLGGGTGSDSDYGLSSFTATDGLISRPNPPTGLTAVAH
jgi:hypothetical protein